MEWYRGFCGHCSGEWCEWFAIDLGSRICYDIDILVPDVSCRFFWHLNCNSKLNIQQDVRNVSIARWSTIGGLRLLRGAVELLDGYKHGSNLHTVGNGPIAMGTWPCISGTAPPSIGEWLWMIRTWWFDALKPSIFHILWRKPAPGRQLLT